MDKHLITSKYTMFYTVSCCFTYHKADPTRYCPLACFLIKYVQGEMYFIALS